MRYDADNLLLYLDFVAERHRVWDRRQANLPGPWTMDPILRVEKFTNVFRILDPGTQFVLTDLAPDSVSEATALMRLFLYRHTGRVDMWQALPRYPYSPMDLSETEVYWRHWRNLGNPVFTNAYLVYPQSSTPGTDKLESILSLTERLFEPSSPEYIVDDFMKAQTQRERFDVLRRTKGVGDFMAMQILTDWGYTPHCGVDRENEFVVLGPGAVKGARHIVPEGKLDEALVVWLRSMLIATHRDLYLDDHEGWPRRSPSYMDTQNTLCEFSKYVRFTQKPPKTEAYAPAHPGRQPAPVLPKHW